MTSILPFIPLSAKFTVYIFESSTPLDVENVEYPDEDSKSKDLFPPKEYTRKVFPSRNNLPAVFSLSLNSSCSWSLLTKIIFVCGFIFPF